MELCLVQAETRVLGKGVLRPISRNFLRHADGDPALYSEQLGNAGS